MSSIFFSLRKCESLVYGRINLQIHLDDSSSEVNAVDIETYRQSDEKSLWHKHFDIYRVFVLNHFSLCGNWLVYTQFQSICVFHFFSNLNLVNFQFDSFAANAFQFVGAFVLGFILFICPLIAFSIIYWIIFEKVTVFKLNAIIFRSWWHNSTPIAIWSAPILKLKYDARFVCKFKT